jgi:predicted  nucleic acid-binding Zn-ribbon protein
MENYISELLFNINDENLKVEKLKNELFKLELEINRLKSFTPTTSDLMFSFGDDNEDIEKNTKEQEIIAKKIRAINLELRKYIK